MPQYGSARYGRAGRYIAPAMQPQANAHMGPRGMREGPAPFDGNGNGHGQYGPQQGRQSFNGQGNSTFSNRGQGQRGRGRGSKSVRARARKQWDSNYGGNGVGYVGPTPNGYIDPPQPPPATVAEPEPKTPKKPLINEQMRIKILDLMTEHANEYDATADKAFFENIASLADLILGIKGLTGADIKTRARMSDVCRERRALGAKMDAKSDLEKAAERWICASSALGQDYARTIEAKRLDNQTVDSLLNAAIGILETHHAVLSSPGAAREDWQQAEVIVGLPLVISAKPDFLTGKQMDAVIKKNRESAPLLKASNRSGLAPSNTPHRAPGLHRGTASAVQEASPSHHRTAAGTREDSSKPWANVPVVADFTSPYPPPHPKAANVGNCGDGRKAKKQRKQEAAESRTARESTADVYRKEYKETVKMARVVGDMKKGVCHPSHKKTKHKSGKASREQRDTSESAVSEDEEPEESEEDAAPPPKKKKKTRGSSKRRKAEVMDDESLDDHTRRMKEKKNKKRCRE